MTFWFSPPLCAATIRKTIELLLMQNSDDSGQTKNPVTLRKRIFQFKTVDIDTATRMLSVKWLSRAGASMDRAERIELLRVFALLEKVVNSCYCEILRSGDQKHARS